MQLAVIHYAFQKEHRTGKRFDSKGACLCAHISEGTCKQCSACDCCDFFRMRSSDLSNEFSGVPVGDGYYIGGHFFRLRKRQ